MATSQTTYDEAPAIGLPGQVANEELANVISRTVESAAGIAFGQPAFQGAGDHGVIVGGATTGTAVAAAQGTNTGNGTFGAITVGTQAQEGVYTVEFNDATHFVVSNPEGEQIGHGTAGAAFSAGGLGFTITAGGTAFVAADSFTVTVDLTTNGDFIGIAKLTPAVPASATAPDVYPQNFTGAFVNRGQIFVVAGATVKPRDPVFWNPATTRYTNNPAHVEIPDAQFDISGSDGVIVEISLKNR
jgi:hypothetical protein